MCVNVYCVKTGSNIQKSSAKRLIFIACQKSNSGNKINIRFITSLHIRSDNKDFINSINKVFLFKKRSS
jgi:hypothetical protein